MNTFQVAGRFSSTLTFGGIAVLLVTLLGLACDTTSTPSSVVGPSLAPPILTPNPPPRPNYSPLRSSDGALYDPGLYTYDLCCSGEPEFLHDADGGYTVSRRKGGLILAFSMPNTPDWRAHGATVKASWGPRYRFSECPHGIFGEPRCGWEFETETVTPGTLRNEQIVITIDRSSAGLESSVLVIPVRVKSQSAS